MDDQRRAAIAQAILDMNAGADFETAIAAQCDALATAIGATFCMTGRTCREAEGFMRSIAKDMAVEHIRKHWGTIEHTGAGPEGHG